jgi:pimeloyl-ACP methyl ester carboxylesterase
MLHYAMSGDAPEGLFLRPKSAGSGILDGLNYPNPLPRSLSQADLDVYCRAYRDGFSGPISWYRGYYRGDRLAADSLEPSTVGVPCHFMVGSRGASRTIQPDEFANVEESLTDLRGNVVLDGAGHWLPLERAREVNSALLAFLSGLEADRRPHNLR